MERNLNKPRINHNIQSIGERLRLLRKDIERREFGLLIPKPPVIRPPGSTYTSSQVSDEILKLRKKIREDQMV